MKYFKIIDFKDGCSFTYFLFSCKFKDSASLAKAYRISSSSLIEEVSAKEYLHWAEGVGCFHYRDSDVDEDCDDDDEEYNLD